MSLNPPLQIAAQPRGRMVPYDRTCLECDRGYTAHTSHGEFCSHKCKLAFHNRRRKRGAEMYDVIMAWRYERPLARALKALSLICRIAAYHRAEDHAHRDGRKSWRPLTRVKESTAHVYADVLVRQEARSDRRSRQGRKQ